MRPQRLSYLWIILVFLLVGCSGSGQGTATNPTPTSTTASSLTPTPTQASNQPRTSGPDYGTSSLPGIKLPQGFQISVYASDLQTPRFMTIGPNGTLLVANRSGNNVVALQKGSSAAKAGKRTVIAENLNGPSSLVVYKGYLYIGENNSIARLRLSNDLQTSQLQRIISLPEGGQHSTRTVLIGSDERIYVSVGSTCNVCEEQDNRRAAVWVYNLDGSQGQLYTRGLRNAVGLEVNPWNNQVWATNNGRDYLGNDSPPETVYALAKGADAGWPHCHAGTIVDPDFGSGNACNGVLKPVEEIQAHSAPLGLDFYPRDASQFAAQYRDSLYIALHGSWNRDEKTGYKVIRVPLRNGAVAGAPEDFITGWLQNGNVSGRPVGITFAPDGTLFVSDDMNGQIYHVWYRG